MFTVCPKCTLTLAVTANDLRVGQGYVRCGRCSNVFNALLKLSEAPAEGAIGADLPELGEADPASTSQIHRAISAAAIDGSTTGPPAAASAALRAPNRAGNAATVQRTAPASTPAAASAPVRTGPAAAAASAAEAQAAPTPAATASRGAPVPASAPAAVSPPRPATPPPPPQAPAASAAPPAAVSAPAPAAQPAAAARAPAPGAASPPPALARPSAAQTTAAAPAAVPSAPRSPQGAATLASAPAATPAARAAQQAPTAPPPSSAAAAPEAARRPSAAASAPAAGAAVRSTLSLSLMPDPPPKEADSDAIDHFELVLKTLGLNADGQESPLLGADGEPTQTVENIVLEGDEITQSEAHVSDRPLDDLDLFTRRLGSAVSEHSDASAMGVGPAAGEADTETALSASDAGAGAGDAATTRPMNRLAMRRARLAQAAARRAADVAAKGDAATAAARAAGRDPAVLAQAESMETGNDAQAAPLPDLDIPGLRAATPLQARLWLGGSVVLALLLLAQAINHWRDALAASPTWGHRISALYATLGVPLQPHWDLFAYEVRQQGAQSENGPHAAIRVRFSLANHAMRPQPMPLLRLTLLDRYGRRVGERDLMPADYWPKGRSPQNFLAADERVDTEIQVRDPSADSASFELDVCLPAAAGSGIRCAGDATAPADGAGPSP